MIIFKKIKYPREGDEQRWRLKSNEESTKRVNRFILYINVSVYIFIYRYISITYSQWLNGTDIGAIYLQEVIWKQKLRTT